MHVVVVDPLWGEGDNFFNMDVCQPVESIPYRTGWYSQNLSYRQVNWHRNTHDSYCLKYRSLPDYTGHTAKYRTSWPKNGYRVVLKTWRKWKKLAAKSSQCHLHWLFSHVVDHSPNLRPSILSSRFSFFFFFFFCFFFFLFSFDWDCSSCAFCFSCVWLSFFFFFFFWESVCGYCLIVLCEF